MAKRAREDERVMPHALDAERAMLGAVLLNNDLADVVSTVALPQHCYREAHAAIFAAMLGLRAERKPIDLVTLREALGKEGLVAAGGPAYLASLVDGLPRSAHAAEYAQIVREKARLRDVVFTAERLAARAYEGEETAAKLAQQATEHLLDVLEAHAVGLQDADAAVEDYFSVVAGGETLPGLPTGFSVIDDLVGGLRRDELAIVAARPSVGKTAIALQIADSMAHHGLAVVFFSVEMGASALGARLLGLRARVPVSRLERGTLSDDESARVAAALTAPRVPLRIEAASTTTAEVAAWCRRAKAGAALDCVVVDYLQLLVSERDDAAAAVAAVSRALKRLAKQEHVVVIALSQLSRAPEGRRDRRPHLADLRGSGALEQDCDLALLLFREEMHDKRDDNEGIAEVIVAKNRNGPTGVLRLAFRADLATFENLEFVYQ